MNKNEIEYKNEIKEKLQRKKREKDGESIIMTPPCLSACGTKYLFSPVVECVCVATVRVGGDV